MVVKPFSSLDFLAPVHPLTPGPPGLSPPTLDPWPRCLANYEKANKDLDMARARNKDVAIAENK